VLAQPWIQEFCQQALKLGATEYLEKPISSTEIERIIKNFLESSRGELRGQGFGRKAELPQK
jgi:DNA-binding NtrC family response regulator